MGYVFQAKCWEKHPIGCSFKLLWLKEIGKGMAKDLERKNDIYWHFIYEDKRNKKKRKVKGRKFHVRRKMIKIEASLIKRVLRISGQARSM